MIRILQYEIENTRGGIESFLFNVYSHIDRERYHFDFVTSADHPGYGKELQNLGAHIYRISSIRNTRKYMRDLKDIMLREYDIIHVNKNSAANILPLVIAKKNPKACIVVHSHNTKPSIGKMVMCAINYINRKKLYELSDVHLACSTEAGNWLYGDRKFELIPNGIDVQRFRFDGTIRREYRKKLGLGDDFTLVTVGRFNEQKNYERLISIFAEVVKERGKAKLLMAGDGKMKEMIYEKARRLSLDDSVKFLGNRSDVDKLLMAADCFVMTSLYEGLPVSVIEAQASGLPVFVSEAVSDEAKIVPDFYHFSLEKSDEEIVDMILSCKKKTPDERLKSNEMVDESDFNIDATVRKLSEIYDNCRLYKNSMVYERNGERC